MRNNSATGASLTFLEDGGQPAEQVAGELAAFCGQAAASLDIAIYDCGLRGDVAATVAASLQQAVQRGVAVRAAYYSGPRRVPGVAPPTGSSEAFLRQTGVPYRPVTGFQALMHQKYVVRDAGSAAATVWTGSTNWTNDSWSREENVILQLPSEPLAALYRADFDELWNRGKLEGSGKRDGGSATVIWEGASVPAHVWFSPGQGEDMAHAVGLAISTARRRIVIASPVLTVGTILGALADVAHAGQVPVTGVYDATQMRQVLQQWGDSPQASWKIQAFQGLVAYGAMAGKHSTPFGPSSVHDFMHLKVIVADDTLFTGSYNFSHSGEENAENLLRLDSPSLAQACVDFINHLINRYRA